MALVGVQAKEALEMKLELERLKASGEFNLQQWRQQQEIDDQKVNPHVPKQSRMLKQTSK